MKRFERQSSCSVNGLYELVYQGSTLKALREMLLMPRYFSTEEGLAPGTIVSPIDKPASLTIQVFLIDWMRKKDEFRGLRVIPSLFM
jgi:hypothetical protein